MSVDELLTQPPPLSEDNIATLRDLHEQQQRKQDLITPLDAKILEATVEDDAIETEVLQAEETNTEISTAKAKISRRLNSISARDTTTPSTWTTARLTWTMRAELPDFLS